MQHLEAWGCERRAAWRWHGEGGFGASNRQAACDGVLEQGQDGAGVEDGEEGVWGGNEGVVRVGRHGPTEAGPAGCGSLREAMALRVQGAGAQEAAGCRGGRRRI